MLRLRDEMRRWRFYDHFRTDSEAPARLAQVGTRTQCCARWSGSGRGICKPFARSAIPRRWIEAIEDAFPARSWGSTKTGWFSLELNNTACCVHLRAAELSDGTLRYLLWIAALLTPRPPSLMVLNEPETSLHPDLLPALAKLIRVASRHTQIWIICHATRLVAALLEDPNCMHFELHKELGQTRLMNQTSLEQPPWKWPTR